MAEEIVLTSLRELAEVRGRFPERVEAVPEERSLVPLVAGSGAEDLEELAREARSALEGLASLLARDGEQRRRAEEGLARWRDAGAAAVRLRRVAAELREGAGRAAALSASALAAPSRRRAEALSQTAGRLATRAEAHALALEGEARALGRREEVARLREEERSRSLEARMRRELALASGHLDGGRRGEARALLAALEREAGAAPGLQEEIAALSRRERGLASADAEAALREARRLHRRDPAGAIELIEAVALEGLPPELARHLYGCWLAACRRLGLLAAIHYRAGPLRGAVLIPAEDGRWEVVSALGLRRWSRGRRLAPRALRGARPLA